MVKHTYFTSFILIICFWIYNLKQQYPEPSWLGLPSKHRGAETVPCHTTWWQNPVSLLLRMDLSGKSTMATDNSRIRALPVRRPWWLLCPWSTEYIRTLMCSCSTWACRCSTKREACTPKQTRDTVTRVDPPRGRAEPHHTNAGCLHPQRQCEWERMVSRVRNLPSSSEIISW